MYKIQFKLANPVGNIYIDWHDYDERSTEKLAIDGAEWKYKTNKGTNHEIHVRILDPYGKQIWHSTVDYYDSKLKMRSFINSLTEVQSTIVEGLIDDNIDVWIESYQDEPPDDWSEDRTKEFINDLNVIKERFTNVIKI